MLLIMTIINSLFVIIFSGPSCGCRKQTMFHTEVLYLCIHSPVWQTGFGCCALLELQLLSSFVIFYLLCSLEICSSFPATSAAPLGGEAAPPIAGLLAAPACAAAIFSTAHNIRLCFFPDNFLRFQDTSGNHLALIFNDLVFLAADSGLCY